jgi:two-component system response regulator RegA
VSQSLLLVDDDESNRIVLSTLLDEHGFEVDVAASFAAAMAKIKADGSRYAIVLLDQHLGDGLGTDLVDPIRARLPHAKVVLISGSVGDDPSDLTRVDAVAPKGVSFPDVLALIKRVTS